MLSALFVACSSASADKQATSGTIVADSASVELPLPVVPTSLTDPADRAAFVMAHFWDSLDFNDTVRCLNDDFVEQNFSNFASLFSIADRPALEQAVSCLMSRAAKQPRVYKKFVDTARKYLYDPNSPMLNEDYYAAFVDCVLSQDVCDEADRVRLTAERGWINQNRVGSIATDFKYRTPAGKVTTLLQTPINEQLLLVLYDPTCDNCHAIIDEMKQNVPINAALADGTLQILAINMLIDEKPSQLPDTWLQGTDLSNIQDRDLYVIRATPSLYIIDSDHRIVAKDISPSQILQ